MNNSTEVKVGFIGAGGIANAHMENLATFEDVEISAICDVDKNIAEERSDAFGGATYSDFEEMLKREPIDALYICTPPFAHGEQEKKAAAMKIPLFIEKPIAVTLEQALSILNAVENAGIITSVGYHWRYSAATARALHELRGKKILGALGYWLGGMPGPPWWRVRAQSGGQHSEQTTHIFDICRYIVGNQVKSVHGVANSGGMTDIPNYDVDDISVVNLEFENGVAANISSCCVSAGPGRAGIEIFCRDLLIGITGKGGFEKKSSGEEDTSLDGYQEIDRDRVFIDAVKTGDSSPIRSNYADALATLRVTLAASESFRTGEVVHLSD